ncbi:10414_t:CDS:1, partial [Racocetra persica]
MSFRCIIKFEQNTFDRRNIFRDSRDNKKASQKGMKDKKDQRCPSNKKKS